MALNYVTDTVWHTRVVVDHRAPIFQLFLAEKNNLPMRVPFYVNYIPVYLRVLAFYLPAELAKSQLVPGKPASRK